MEAASTDATSQKVVATAAPFSITNRVGFVLALLLGLADLPSMLTPTPDGEVGPPYPVLVLGTLCGLITVVAVAVGWARRNRAAIRVAAGARIISLLGALPALFVDGLPAWIRVLVAGYTIVTFVAVVLMLKPARARTV